MPQTEHVTHFESKEQPKFQLTIVVHRHGEKTGLTGGLSERGIEDTEEYFREAYKGIPLDLPEGEGVDIEHSPITRTEETALLAVQHSGFKINSIRSDERLSEGMIAHHEDLINSWGGLGGRWIPTWMSLTERPFPDVKTGQEAAREFTQWLLEKIEYRKKQGGTQEIDAFSHYPLMIAFLLKIEEKLGVQLLPENWQEQKRSFKIVNYLGNFNIYINSENPDNVNFSYNQLTVTVPLTVLREIAQVPEGNI